MQARAVQHQQAQQHQQQQQQQQHLNHSQAHSSSASQEQRSGTLAAAKPADSQSKVSQMTPPETGLTEEGSAGPAGTSSSLSAEERVRDSLPAAVQSENLQSGTSTARQGGLGATTDAAGGKPGSKFAWSSPNSWASKVAGGKTSNASKEG